MSERINTCHRARDQVGPLEMVVPFFQVPHWPTLSSLHEIPDTVDNSWMKEERAKGIPLRPNSEVLIGSACLL